MSKFNKTWFLFLTSFRITFASVILNPQAIQNELKAKYSGSEQLDHLFGKYQLSWSIDEDNHTIHFSVIAESTGFVGFGLSPYGQMWDGDIFIAGVDPQGNQYGMDYHMTDSRYPTVDESQDWILDFAKENATHTELSFYRLLNTCDDNDFEITDNTLNVIWALGTTDDLQYHNDRGSKPINFYLGNDDGFPTDDYEKLDITVETEMPDVPSTNWCTIHELPEFTEKRHIVAFEPVLESQDASLYTHYFLFHRCIAPPGEDPAELFKPWTTHPGDHCYGSGRNESFPFEKYCRGNIIYSWGNGGNRMVFPENVGFPISEDGNVREYYALEVHYDNVFNTTGKKFKTGGRIFHTDKLRDIEAGLMVVQHNTGVQLIVPPNSEEFIVSGHCSAECTHNLLPEEGITIFNVLLHAHLYGEKMKLRHFWGDQELEWVDRNEHFDFFFQPNKQLVWPRKIERGDQLTVECTSRSSEGFGDMAVIGGLSSYDAKCQAWVYYWPRADVRSCGSSQDLEEHFTNFGFDEVREMESVLPGGLPTYEVVKPDNLAGNYMESVSHKVNWTDEFRSTYQQEKRSGQQVAFCNGKIQESLVKYPENLNEYLPGDCQESTDPPEQSSTTPQESDISTTSQKQESSSTTDGSETSKTTLDGDNSSTPENVGTTTIESSGQASIACTKFIVLTGIFSLFIV